MHYFALFCVGLPTHLLTVVSFKGFKIRVSVIRYKPMFLFYQITSNFVSFNAEKTSGILFSTAK